MHLLILSNGLSRRMHLIISIVSACTIFYLMYNTGNQGKAAILTGTSISLQYSALSLDGLLHRFW
jgi:hypothetical protein